LDGDLAPIPFGHRILHHDRQAFDCFSGDLVQAGALYPFGILRLVLPVYDVEEVASFSLARQLRGVFFRMWLLAHAEPLPFCPATPVWPLTQLCRFDRRQ
jgi:hypothetical protein